MGVAEEQKVRMDRPGVGDGPVIALLDPPLMSVGQQDGGPAQNDLLLGDGGSPAVTVAGHTADGQLGVGAGDLLRVIHNVPQVNDLVRAVEVDGPVHPGQGAMGVGKN